MPLTFTPLEDANCEGITPSGTTELALGKEETFTCTHVLTGVGKYHNSASIEANDPIKGKSNEVTVEVPAQPSYTIEKQQRIKGEANYSTAEKTGKLGQTVEYRVTVKNTGNVPLKFAALKDTGCEGLTPSGATELKAAEEESFTCTHVLAVGTANNEATIEGNEGTGTKTSNKVTVKVPANPAYTIEKQQRIAGEPFFTVSELTAELGETVEYQIIVNNTGNVPLKFAPLKDSGCEGITPSGATELQVGTGETFLCSHVLGTLGSYTNEASIEPNEGGTKNSNKVVVKVPTKAVLHDRKAAADRRRTRLQLQPNTTGKLGQTVEYQIVVKNTGNVALKFGALKDANCEGIIPCRRDAKWASAAKSPSRCSHTLAVGTYTNEASIEGNEGTGTKTSNKVDDESAGRTVVHDRKAAADRRRRQLQHRRTERQTRPDRRLQDHRQEHRQRAAQTRRPERLRLRRHHALRRHRTESRRRRVLHLQPTADGRHEHQRSLDRRQRRHRQKDLQQGQSQSRRPNRPSRSKRNRRSKAKAASRRRN